MPLTVAVPCVAATTILMLMAVAPVIEEIKSSIVGVLSGTVMVAPLAIGAAGLIVIVTVWLLLPVTLVAVTVVLVVPLTVGVPEMMPVAVSILNPAGKGVALKLVGLLVAVMA